MSATALRPRSVTEIIDAAFHLLREHYGAIVTLSAIALIPYALAVIFFGIGTIGTVGAPVAATAVFAPAALAVTFVGGLCAMLAEAAVVRGLSDSYLSGQVDVGPAFQRALSRLPSVVGCAIMRGFLIAVGLLFLIVPGIYLAVRTFAVNAAIVIEDEGAFGALARSWELTRGRAWPAFLTFFLAGLIYFVIYVVLFALVTALILVVHNQALSAVVTIAALALIYPFISAVTTVLYYDLRVRKEGFDLDVMARSLGAPGPVPQPGTAG